MKLELLKEHWDAFGRTDPLWAILTDPDKRGGKWQLDEFLATGPLAIASTMQLLEEVGARPASGRALDFGCGIGRLTQALAEYFERCDGVDIANSMIERARAINRFGGRVTYHLNAADNLSLFEDESFDFVLSLIVLQHMEPGYMASYVREFARLLRPGGVALFQIPSLLHSEVGAPLPREACQARLAFVGELPAELSAGDQASVQVRVSNISPEPWAAGLKVGNHWSGPVEVRDDGRAELGALQSGEQAQVELKLVAPAVPGTYTLEVDVVQERVSWFGELGSPGTSTTVEVLPAPRHRPDDRLAAPKMEMYAMAVDDVLALVDAAGCEVVARREMDACGDGIRSYHYVVRR